MTDLATLYGQDASSERRSTYVLYAVAVALALAGGALAVRGIAVAHTDTTLRFSIFAAYASVGLASFTAAGVSLRQARRHLMAAHEATRLQRQLVALDAYLLPMPPAMRDLVRGALVQRVFPGLVDDDEPWRAPVWPDSVASFERSTPTVASSLTTKSDTPPPSRFSAALDASATACRLGDHHLDRLSVRQHRLSFWLLDSPRVE